MLQQINQALVRRRTSAGGMGSLPALSYFLTLLFSHGCPYRQNKVGHVMGTVRQERQYRENVADNMAKTFFLLSSINLTILKQ